VSPFLLFNFHEGFEFAQMVSVAQSMQHVGHQVVWFPVVMHGDAAHAGQQAAALGGDPIEGQQQG
jgi:hypothetical protein